MKHCNTLLYACLLAVLTAGCRTNTQKNAAAACATVEPVTCGSIKQIHTVGDLYLAAQPSAEDYALLRDLGIQTVLDLRHGHEQRGFDEQAVVTALGMQYVHLPWSGPDELTDKQIDAMRKTLRESERPTVMKCGSSNRVGAGWLAYRVLDEGVAVDQALAEAKTIGMRNPAYETIVLRYIDSQ